MAEKKKSAPKKAETKAEASARIQKELLARGAKIQTKEQIAAQRERAGKRQAALPQTQPAARAGNGNGAPMQRRGVEYMSGKAFDETTRKALKRSGAE